ncbi:MAG: hypothetical protein Q9169_005093 [Polycauliona sp. 2 TL-2023]
MDELLVPLKTTKTQSSLGNPGETHLVDTEQRPVEAAQGEITSSIIALEILRSRPKPTDLVQVTKWLHPRNSTENGFDIHGQTLQASQIIHTLVNDVLPDYWSLLNSDESKQNRRIREAIVLIISNVSGITVLTSRLKTLIGRKEVPKENHTAGDSGQVESMASTLSVLESILKPKDIVYAIWSRLCTSSDPPRGRLLWKELVGLLGGGRVLSTVSEADAILNKSSDRIRERSWLSDGSKYCFWLGSNLHQLLVLPTVEKNDARKACVKMLERALTLGHVDQTIQGTFEGLVSGTGDLSLYTGFTQALSHSTKKIVVYSLLRLLARTHLDTSSKRTASYPDSPYTTSDVATLLSLLSRNDGDFTKLLIEWLSSDGIVQDLRIRRAIIATLAEDLDTLKSTFTGILRTFGDKLHIKHAPVLHQEGLTENLLLLVGYVYRKLPSYLAETARSSLYLNSISNRLAASSQRVSLLGMYLGTAMSKLIDPPERRMNFDSEEMTSSRGQRYLSLTEIQDSLGSMDDLKRKEVKSELSFRPAKTTASKEKNPKERNEKASEGSKIISIEEVDDQSEDEVLPMYAKPDSDASDSDDDPTVIERNKPTAPVYIDDLISGLRDTENYNRHFLALTHASPLIRRKAAFGTEVTDNSEAVANILTGLGDKWNIEDFQELRLQGMIAVLVAQPLELGQWFSKTYFNGDYSIQQRTTVLTTLGLGARELAGYGKEDMALTKSNASHNSKYATAFPSKRLPPNLHALYASGEKSAHPDIPGAKAVDTASRSLEKSILQPMALQAADALSGPNALKVRTFSSRMEVEKRRTKPIPNALAKVVADGFFFPLTGRWGMHVQGHGKNSPLLGTPLLPLFLKTLALIFHASGPSTLQLPLMTSEFLSLILSLRSHSSGSLPVMDALLFAFLTVLEVNSASDQGRRLAAENGKALLEMGEWVEGVLGAVRGDGEEEGRVKALAAGCVGRVREVVEREERVLAGELAGLM